MRNVSVEEVKRLYVDEQLSALLVAQRLGCSIWKVYKIMKKHDIPRRSAAETSRFLFDSSPLSFCPKEQLSREEEILKHAALMLYWAEGSKRAFGTVDLANSDPEMVVLFTKCLREIYRVSETRLRVFLYCHANQSVEQLQKYWSEVSGIPLTQFTKPYIREGAASKYHVMPHGLVHIRYSDQRLFTLIMHDSRELIDSMLGYSSGQRELTVNGSLPSKDGLQSGRIAGKLSSSDRIS
jgi:hypothetical protein